MWYLRICVLSHTPNVRPTPGDRSKSNPRLVEVAVSGGLGRDRGRSTGHIPSIQMKPYKKNVWILLPLARSRASRVSCRTSRSSRRPDLRPRVDHRLKVFPDNPREQSLLDSRVPKLGGWGVPAHQSRTAKDRARCRWANTDLNRGPPGYQPSAQPD